MADEHCIATVAVAANLSESLQMCSALNKATEAFFFFFRETFVTDATDWFGMTENPLCPFSFNICYSASQCPFNETI